MHLYELYSDGMNSLYSYGMNLHGLYSYGMSLHGLYSYGPFGSDRRRCEGIHRAERGLGFPDAAVRAARDGARAAAADAAEVSDGRWLEINSALVGHYPKCMALCEIRGHQAWPVSVPTVAATSCRSVCAHRARERR